ncbi:MAG: acyltransferase [Schleiferiaceae bacterium]|nr:acyltransferase [Schleiferiaceae bacterium]
MKVQQLVTFLKFIIRASERLVMHVYKYELGKWSKGIIFHPFSTKIVGAKNIFLGEYSTIGPQTVIYAIEAKLIIGKKSGIGPGCLIFTGNHNVKKVGKFYKDYNIKDKTENDDKDILIGEDVWIGAGCIILKGVTIGRGAVIGAGSLVNSDIPPYSVAYGNPATVQSMRFTNDEISSHESILFLNPEIE